MWLRVATAGDDVACELRRGRARAIPRKPGERVKTNRRNARKLVELGRAGLLTAVQPPAFEDRGRRGPRPGAG